jgi:hypothetical protein
MAFAFADAPPLLLLDMTNRRDSPEWFSSNKGLLGYRQSLCKHFS